MTQGITQRLYGKLPSGEPVHEYTLSNGGDVTIKVITYGGIITEWHLPDREGNTADVVLGFESLESYLPRHPYFGCITGRVAGRLTHGHFALDGIDYQLAINDPPNHLHGGLTGLDKRLWKAEPSTDGGVPKLRLTYLSPDGEEGYPGNVQIAVTYSVTKSNEVVIDYEATTDAATPLSLTNHSYFNLAGEGSGRIDDHVLQIFSDEYAPADESMTLQDRKESVDGKANEFRTPKRIGDALPGIWNNHGDNYFIRPAAQSGLAPVAILSEPRSGRVLSISSTEPCLQLYTGSSLDGSVTGKAGHVYRKHGAVCLECQGYPNGVNVPAMGDIVLQPGSTYRQTTVHTCSIAK